MRTLARSLFDPLIFPQIFKMGLLLWDLTPRLVDTLGASRFDFTYGLFITNF